MLRLKHVSVHYGKTMALDDISIEVTEESVVSIIGANGAGKSTILRTVSGLKPLTGTCRSIIGGYPGPLFR